MTGVWREDLRKRKIRASIQTRDDISRYVLTWRKHNTQPRNLLEAYQE